MKIMPRSGRYASVLAGIFLAGTLGTSISAGSKDAHGDRIERTPVVQTDTGPVQGFVEKGVAQFLGIPYAEPPVTSDPTERPAHPAIGDGALP